MVLPLRLSWLLASGVLVFVACPATTPPQTEPAGDAAGDGQASAAELGPVEAEPEPGPAVETRGARDQPEQFEHEGVVLGLAPADCVLIAEHGEQRLEHHFEFPAECHFAVGDDGAPRTVATDAGLTLMVESSKRLEQDCDTALRVIVIGAEGPKLSRAVQRVAMCDPGGGDEMMFHVLSSETVSFGTAGQDP